MSTEHEGCKFCSEIHTLIEDYPNHKFKIIKDEFGNHILATTYGEPLMKLSSCPKCGRLFFNTGVKYEPTRY